MQCIARNLEAKLQWLNGNGGPEAGEEELELAAPGLPLRQCPRLDRAACQVNRSSLGFYFQIGLQLEFNYPYKKGTMTLLLSDVTKIFLFRSRLGFSTLPSLSLST